MQLPSENRQLDRRNLGGQPVAEQFEHRVQETTVELETAISELQSFCSCLSHDLRAPLRHINSYSAVLLEDFAGFLPPAAQQYLQLISSSSSRMGHMIDQLLELSRVNRTDMALGEIDLSKMARQVLQFLKENESHREVETVVGDTPPVLADRGMLRQFMENVLGNAWKYTSREHRARIEFGMTSYQDKDVFFISDNGVGFDMAYTSKLFGTFERLHGMEFDGVGIGLATAHRIIRRHGGEIWGEGVVGEGATFYFTLPVASARAPS